MGFLDKFASFFLTEENTETSLLPNANHSDDIDGDALEDSITLKLANLKQKLTLIEQAPPDKVDKLKDEINDLENKIITSSNSEFMMAIENEYLNLENQFNKLESLCKQFLVQKEQKRIEAVNEEKLKKKRQNKKKRKKNLRNLLLLKI